VFGKAAKHSQASCLPSLEVVAASVTAEKQPY
jgi:hypothetical protein